MLKNKKIILIISGILLLSGAAFLGFKLKNQKALPQVQDFKSCVAAGFPVLESYPRQCQTADGATFTEEIKEEACQSDEVCGEGFYCQDSNCHQFSPDLSCNRHVDCQLIKKDLRFDCNWLGACDSIDYSLPSWISVNKGWFTSEKEKACFVEGGCLPPPACNPTPINDNFTSKCINGTCQKVAKEEVKVTKTKKITSCDQVDWDQKELDEAMIYCRGDLCNVTKNQDECEAKDVIKIEDGGIVSGQDGQPDCIWIGCPNNICWPKR